MRWVMLPLLCLALVAPAQARMPQPPVVRLSMAPCPDGGGTCVDPSSALIYLNGQRHPFWRAHETGHLFRRQLVADSDRPVLARLMGTRDEWSVGSEADEWFADYFAACDLGLNPDKRWVDSYAPQPSYSRLRRICNAISVIGRVRGGVVPRPVRKLPPGQTRGHDLM